MADEDQEGNVAGWEPRGQPFTIDGDPVNKERFDQVYNQPIVGRAYPAGGAQPKRYSMDYRPVSKEAFEALYPPKGAPGAWISLPCVEFAPRESSLVQAGGGSLAPLFYECDVCVADIARISQVPYPEEHAHAPSAITLKGGGTFFCTLTRQQLRKRLGIVVEEVAP